DVVADQRKTQLRIVEQQSFAAEREAGQGVARPGLVIGKTAMRGAAAAEKALRQRNSLVGVEPRLRHAKRLNPSELQAARQYILLPERMIRRITAEEAQKVPAGSKEAGRQTQVDGVVDAAMRIGRVVAAILDDVAREHADAHGLGEQRNQQRLNLQCSLVHAHTPVGEAE